jgi:hypothetical protein
MRRRLFRSMAAMTSFVVSKVGVADTQSVADQRSDIRVEPLMCTASRYEMRAPYARAIVCPNVTSISVPECGPVLIWNWARLASTSALVSARLTPEPLV